MTLRAGAVAAAVASLLVMGACSSSGDGDRPMPSTTPPGAATADGATGEAAAADGGPAAGTIGTGDDIVVAESTATVELHTSPQATSPFTAMDADPTSGRNVFLVVGELGDWLHVRPPTGDGREQAWVLRRQVTLSRHRFRIEVSRSAHTLTLRSGAIEALRVPVAIGPDAPPAGSRLFIKDLVTTPDPAGRFGQFAYGLSGSSNEPADFRSGSGVVAVHGTNAPHTLGTDVSTGSIAVNDGALVRMVETLGLPLGTPVDVVD
jgi:hypothetical protein